MMSGKPGTDRRAQRHAATREEIVGAAWDLVHEQGLTGWSMRELGERVGMRAQSLYSYFPSKHDVYDALFHDGNVAFGAEMRSATAAVDPAAPTRDRLVAASMGFVQFCTSDPMRHQLLFQRPIPDFTPSAASYDAALAAYEQFRTEVAAAGVSEQASLDLWSATMSGLAAQQIANDPGGDRWNRLVPRAVDMLLTDTGRVASVDAETGGHVAHSLSPTHLPEETR